MFVVVTTFDDGDVFGVYGPFLTEPEADAYLALILNGEVPNDGRTVAHDVLNGYVAPLEAPQATPFGG